ncbi:hypothetical protein [Pseudozobellia thermophila]|uniref:Uncharacterized protein n=1 Tax=Pseudozobellia thermophila TaxID=192903 RepID=A0A1M6J4Y6_9FLAO|nr:hypothetical protein [Pseudozobellia thermophila]SHJ41743.1 hypothetical protein SAMN04488513_104248 [Pseudozobellia thermophila]
MKKIMFLCLSTLWFSACDDGDLQIEQVDFDSVSISTCGDVDDATETTFFFKIDGDEALLLNLESGLLANETSSPESISSSIPSSSSLIYRFFSDDVSQDYFCDVIPSVEPVVLEENTATAGDINIDTQVGSATETGKNYRHTISITGLSLTNSQGESITDASTFEYGTFTTSTDNSAHLDTPFSNYLAIDAYSECSESPSGSAVRLYKTINDEFISLDIPLGALAASATPDSEPRQVDLADALFRYVVVDTLATDDMACTTAPLGEEIEAWYYESTSGTLNIETVVGDTDENGTTTYTHTFTLDSLVLTLKANDEDDSDTTLDLIENVEMGSYTTFGN